MFCLSLHASSLTLKRCQRLTPRLISNGQLCTLPLSPTSPPIVCLTRSSSASLHHHENANKVEISSQYLAAAMPKPASQRFCLYTPFMPDHRILFWVQSRDKREAVSLISVRVSPVQPELAYVLLFSCGIRCPWLLQDNPDAVTSRRGNVHS